MSHTSTVLYVLLVPPRILGILLVGRSTLLPLFFVPSRET